MNRLRAFAHALRGLRFLFVSQPNARIQAACAILAAVLGFLLRITAAEWGLVLLSIGLVLGMEALNTALEQLADAVSPERREEIGRVKDVAAAGVLIACAAAGAVGTVVFLPRLLTLFWLAVS